MKKIAQIFVAFSEKLNFNQPKCQILLDKNNLLRDLYAMTLAIPTYLSTYYCLSSSQFFNLLSSFETHKSLKLYQPPGSPSNDAATYVAHFLHTYK